ncbi:ubiquinone anaerobic biosynthesis accessory factor UbiT [Caldimonas caldifontis]|uniref:Ubiquinone biosynthesis accessory factor UbiT n=1 Tax=Caldimonas caldifontis TaxID=1452508 RepID=A0A2S5SRC8_9BURK|nr:SCP2 sterol-binding domain-containing protein [Caldimonas caldifontis]PPE65280.1 sterol-binding protein [Caldimonas caldifontis]
MNATSVPARWPAPPQALRSLVQRLPIRPPSQVLALALNRLLRHRLDEPQRALLSHRVVEIAVWDLGLRCRLRLDERGFHPASDGGDVTLRIAADAASYLRLMRGQEDADRLFFERALVMEGDTEYGLILKNTLDALGPLWPPR